MTLTTLDRRGITRETNTPEPIRRRKVLIVRLEVGGRMLRIKVKGTRTWYTVPFDEIYRMGIRIKAQELKAEKLERRAARRGR